LSGALKTDVENWTYGSPITRIITHGSLKF
jgi:hypothetical protein